MTPGCDRRRRLRALLFVLATGGMVAACSGSLFQSRQPPTSVYLLSADLRSPADPASAGTGTPAVPADLTVRRPRMRTGLDTDRIAALYPDHRLDYFADARWSGPLDEVVQDLVLQAFHTGADLRNVSADEPALGGGYWLEIEVANFEANYTSGAAAPSIRVHLLARLGRAADPQLVASFAADVTRKAAGNRLSAIVDAYQDAADAALADIVANTLRRVAQNSESPVASDSRYRQ